MGSSPYETPTVFKRTSCGGHCGYRTGCDRRRSRFRWRVERVRPALCLRGLRDRLHRFGGDAIGGPFSTLWCGCGAFGGPPQSPVYASANFADLLVGGGRGIGVGFVVFAAMVGFVVMQWWG